MTPKPCLECGALFAPQRSSQQMFCAACTVKRDKLSRFESNKRRRIQRKFGDEMKQGRRCGAGSYESWQVISCPDDEFPIGARLDKMSMKLTLEAGYMPVGMRLRDLRFGYEVVVKQSGFVRQELVRI